MRSRTLITGALVRLLVSLAITGSIALADGPNAIITSPGCQATELPANDDGSSPTVTLPFAINYFGQTYSQLWVNNNGNVTFNGSLSTFTPFNLLTTQSV